jgi:hypothetical protein
LKRIISWTLSKKVKENKGAGRVKNQLKGEDCKIYESKNSKETQNSNRMRKTRIDPSFLLLN